jgi:hypothetical protein
MVANLHKKTALIILFSSFFCCTTRPDLTSLAKNDPYPVFTAVDLQVDRLLLSRSITQFRDEYRFRCRNDKFFISASPFGQSATHGKNIKGENIYRRVPIQLGDLTGRWGLFPLMYGTLPQGVTSLPPLLQAAFNFFFPGDPPPTDPMLQEEEAYKVDPNQRCGYLSFPLNYKKRGLRLSATWNFGCGLGLNIEGGVASISQSLRDLPAPFCKEDLCFDQTGDDMTLTPTCDFQPLDLTSYEVIPEANELTIFNPTDDVDPCMQIIGVSKTDIQTYLSRPFPCIAKEINLDLGNFAKVSSEELRFNLYWIGMYEYYKNSYEWAHVAIIPNLMFSASVSPGKPKNEHKAFAAYFGNNRHTAVGGTAGLYLDFAKTIQIGGEVSFTYFFERTYTDLRIPNNKFQTTVFPFYANAKVKPGSNLFFGLKILAYHFLDTLSAYVQYNAVSHGRDKISLVTPDPAFLPEVLESVTSWSNQSINAGFSYDILPNFGVGFLWQAPINQRNSYQSTTLMLTLYGFF